jgi:hypothetical protein
MCFVTGRSVRLGGGYCAGGAVGAGVVGAGAGAAGAAGAIAPDVPTLTTGIGVMPRA